MDYDFFNSEYKKYEDWESNKKDWEYLDNETFKNSNKWDFPNLDMHNQASLKDGKHWLRIAEGYDSEKDTPIDEAVARVNEVRENIDRFVHERYVAPVDNDGEIFHPFGQKDMVNSPAHYTRGTQECIDIIEEAIQDAPDVKAGMLQAQALKYMLRLWLKGNAPQDSEKARWYLNRLIEHLADSPGER